MSTDILVADDEPHITRALAFVLQQEGYHVSLACDGAEALTLIREQRPKVAFIDLIMPKLTGTEVCDAIKADPALRNTHIVILTCKGQELDRAASLACGADEFMTKPFSPREVLTHVRKILQKAC